MIEEPLPILYKYYPPERLDIFENWSIRFTDPSRFNDAFDTNFDAGDDLRRMLVKILFHRRLGIFCLSEDPNEQLMWVHYAAQHTGFVVGFLTADKVFTEDNSVLLPVIYGDPPSETLRNEPQIELCRYKTKNWEYEKEWRCIRQLEPGMSRDVAFDLTAIAKIILGSKMAKHNISLVLRILEALRDEYYKVPDVFESKADLTRRCFTHEPASVQYCTHCRGWGHSLILRGAEGPLHPK